MYLEEAYAKLRRAFLWYADIHLHPGLGDVGPEDVLHDACVYYLEHRQPGHCTALLRMIIRSRAITARHRPWSQSVPLGGGEPDPVDVEETVGIRRRLDKAAAILAAEELNLLLSDWDRRVPRNFAKRIRIARRKLRGFGEP